MMGEPWEKLCWVCGDRMGRFMVFVAGPMCGINRTSSEPPCHLECAQWSARNCPFLNNPEAIRRTDDVVPLSMDNVAGHAITRNPGVTMLWTTNHYNLFPDGKGKNLIYMGVPIAVEWYAHGRAATRQEVQESIKTGLPALAVVAQTQDGALKLLQEARESFEKWIPKEAL